MTESPRQTSAVWYALRRTLPPHAFEANLAEMVACLPRYGVDEVIVIVDPEELSHGLTPLDWIERYLPMLSCVKAALASIGVAYSLNPWVTHGHTDRARNAQDVLSGAHRIVGHDGAVSQGCACSLDPIWRQWMTDAWSRYAGTEPRVMWVEDDIRLFNHGPVRYGCFCDLHLQQISQAVGQTVHRDELVAAILQPGRPHPWRQNWLDLQGRNMIEVATFLHETVHAVSPTTSLGLMSSGPRAHCLEGRCWDEFCTALGGNGPIFSRPPLGNYHEESLRGLYLRHDSIKLTRHVTPAGTIEQSEVENVPFTCYANSLAFTFLKMAVSVATGSAGMTLNLYDHLGTPMADDPNVGAMLAEKKPWLDALAGVSAAAGRLRGVQILHHPRASYCRHLAPGDGYAQLEEDGYAMMEMLESFGIATTYEPATVTATSGQVLRCLDDQQLKELLSGCVLLDGTAAGVVFQRGFGELIGLQNWRGLQAFDDPTSGPISAEAMVRPEFGGGEEIYVTAQLPDIGHDVFGAGRFAVAELQPTATIVSHLVNPDLQRLHPCMYVFENALGGRIAVTLWDLATAYGAALRHPRRAAQMHEVVRWLGRGCVEVIASGGAYPLALRRDLDDLPTTLLGLFNLSLDPWTEVTWQIDDDRHVAALATLNADGHWVADDRLTVTSQKNNHVIRAAIASPYDQPLFVKVQWR